MRSRDEDNLAEAVTRQQVERQSTRPLIDGNLSLISSPNHKMAKSLIWFGMLVGLLYAGSLAVFKHAVQLLSWP
jgi:hypothetical protein